MQKRCQVCFGLLAGKGEQLALHRSAPRFLKGLQPSSPFQLWVWVEDQPSAFASEDSRLKFVQAHGQNLRGRQEEGHRVTVNLDIALGKLLQIQPDSRFHLGY